ncbi:MAG: hypothetical protein E7380_03935 [Clostridiales bacterium]|nr:hypothetical protein [Clostridiales bacterium]MBQ2769457.1 hypothetical protein [Clostridia bacterium]
MEKFALGVLLGGMGGALLVANNYKMRTLVRKTQDEIQAKFDSLMDEKIRAMDEEKAEEKAEERLAKKREAKAEN